MENAALAFTFITGLGSFGVETTSFVALLGALGLALGLALQGAFVHAALGEPGLDGFIAAVAGVLPATAEANAGRARPHLSRQARRRSSLGGRRGYSCAKLTKIDGPSVESIGIHDLPSSQQVI